MSDESDSARQLLRSIATRLFDTYDRELSIELSEEEHGLLSGFDFTDVVVDGNTLSFSNLKVRNTYAAEDFFSEMDVPSQAIRFEHFMKVRRLSLYIEEKEKRGRFLARFEGQNLLAAAARIIREQKPAASDVFGILHGVEDALPFLENVTVEDILDLTEAQDETTRDDGMRGRLFSSLTDLFIRRTDLAVKMLDVLRERISDVYAPLYQSAALAYVKVDKERGVARVLSDIAIGNPTLSRAAIWALGNRIVHDEIPEVPKVQIVNTILEAMRSDDIRLREVALAAAATAAPVVERFSEELLRQAESSDADAILAHLTLIAYNRYSDIKTHPEWPRWLAVLSQIPASANADMLDMCLYSMIEDGDGKAVVEWLEKWMRRNAAAISKKHNTVIKAFDSAINALYNDKPLLGALLTQWMLTREFAFLATAQSILQDLSVHGVKSVEFEESLLMRVGAQEALLLTKHTLGYVLSEEQLLSLLKSMMTSGNSHFRAFMVDVMVDEVGEDYPSDTLEFLKSWKASESDTELTEFFESSIDRIQARMDALHALPSIPELTPSSEASFEFGKRRHQMMSKVQEEAHENSIIAKLATQIHVKGGKGSFSMRDGTYMPPSYFGSFSTSMKLPRRHVIDELGTDMRLLHLRTTGLKEE